ncbi:MAG TPA: hypothetical protein VMV63_08160, partial [Acidithiobacillus sp.]|nr:hypothetical protein [Acidithiobacillus sp.]
MDSYKAKIVDYVLVPLLVVIPTIMGAYFVMVYHFPQWEIYGLTPLYVFGYRVYNPKYAKNKTMIIMFMVGFLIFTSIVLLYEIFKFPSI